jgi:hypothetical protein
LEEKAKMRIKMREGGMGEGGGEEERSRGSMSSGMMPVKE